MLVFFTCLWLLFHDHVGLDTIEPTSIHDFGPTVVIEADPVGHMRATLHQSVTPLAWYRSREQLYALTARLARERVEQRGLVAYLAVEKPAASAVTGRNREKAVPVRSTVRRSESAFRELARTALQWASTEDTQLGCALGVSRYADTALPAVDNLKRSIFGILGISLMATQSNAVIVERCRGCHSVTAGRITARGSRRDHGCPTSMTGASCDSVRSVDGELGYLGPICESFSGVLDSVARAMAREEPPTAPAGTQISMETLCIRWALQYGLRLALLVLTVVSDDPGRSVPTVQVDELEWHRANVTRAYDGLTSCVADAPAFAEGVLGDVRLQTLLQTIAHGDSVLLTVPSVDRKRSVLAMLKEQRGRVSPGPLSPQSYITLSSGHRMPLIGLGTGFDDVFTHADGQCMEWVSSDSIEADPTIARSCDYTKFVELVTHAIVNLGVRLIDTAPYYGTEAAVFTAVRKAVALGVPRDQLFLMTKTWPIRMHANVGEVLPGGERGVLLDPRLQAAGIDYVDLYAEHHAAGESDPVSEINASNVVWSQMRGLQRQGLVRSLGLSGTWKVGGATKQDRIGPCQFGGTPREYLNAMEDGTGHPPVLMNNITLINVDLVSQCRHEPLIMKLASWRGVSGAQYLIRWSLQAGVPVLIGSNNLDHIKEDMDVYGFALSEAEMHLIDRLMSLGDINMPAFLDFHFGRESSCPN